MLAIIKEAGFNLSPHELSAFFRNPAQPQYRLCKDQVLRNFLKGLQLRFGKLKNPSQGRDFGLFLLVLILRFDQASLWRHEIGPSGPCSIALTLPISL